MSNFVRMNSQTTVQWDNDAKTIVRCDYQRMMSWEAFYAAQREIAAHIDESSGVVDVILNYAPVAYVPSGIMLQFGRIAKGYAHPRRGVTVIVGANFFLKTMVNLFAKFQQARAGEIRFADTVEQARAMLTKRD